MGVHVKASSWEGKCPGVQGEQGTIERTPYFGRWDSPTSSSCTHSPLIPQAGSPWRAEHSVTGETAIPLATPRVQVTAQEGLWFTQTQVCRGAGQRPEICFLSLNQG